MKMNALRALLEFGSANNKRKATRELHQIAFSSGATVTDDEVEVDEVSISSSEDSTI
jgi:hypothetical protein